MDKQSLFCVCIRGNLGRRPSRDKLTRKSMARKRLAKYTVVLLESLAGTGHQRVLVRMREAEKVERIMKDPIVGQDVLYKEIKKIRSVKVPRRI